VFPELRGGRVSNEKRSKEALFPTPVGVVRTEWLSEFFKIRVSRMCGGEPEIRMDAKKLSGCSPRLRG